MCPYSHKQLALWKLIFHAVLVHSAFPSLWGLLTSPCRCHCPRLLGNGLAWALCCFFRRWSSCSRIVEGELGSPSLRSKGEAEGAAEPSRIMSCLCWDAALHVSNANLANTLWGPRDLRECWSHFNAGGEAVLAFCGGSACLIAQPHLFIV